MPHQKDFTGISAIIADIAMHPTNRFGAIFNKGGKVDIRVKPIVGDDHDHASRGQSLSNEEIIRLRSILPTPAIEENGHAGIRFEVIGNVDIETVTSLITINDIALHPKAAFADHSVQEPRRRAANRWNGKRQASSKSEQLSGQQAHH